MKSNYSRENNNDLDKDRKKEHMVEKTIDARGLTCPKPVILTKKEMDQSQPQDVVLVDVDNEMAVANLRKLANSQEAEYASVKLGDKHYQVRITVTKEGGKETEMPQNLQNCSIAGQKKTVVVISSDKMGDGEEKLGEILMKGFVYALTKEMEQSQPQDVILVDVDNEMAVENLRKLANSQEAEYASVKLGDKHYQVRITVTKEGGKEAEMPQNLQNCSIAGSKKTVVVISSDKMGDGEEKLGEILMKGFVYALTQLDTLPSTVLLYNKGS